MNKLLNIPMRVVNGNSYINKIYWRYRSKNPKHDFKTSIRNDSIFENLKISLRILYFLYYYCLNENKSIENSYIEYQNYAN